MRSTLFRIFWADPFVSLGVRLLETSFLEALSDLEHRRGKVPPSPCHQGDATILQIAFEILATSIRIAPETTCLVSLPDQPTSVSPGSSDNLVGSPSPSHDDRIALQTQYNHRTLLLAPIADADDRPSIMRVFCKLLWYRYSMLCAGTSMLSSALNTNLRVGQSNQSRLDPIESGSQSLSAATTMAEGIGLLRNSGKLPDVEHAIRHNVRLALFIANADHGVKIGQSLNVVDRRKRFSWLQPSRSLSKGLGEMPPPGDYHLSEALCNSPRSEVLDTELYLHACAISVALSGYGRTLEMLGELAKWVPNFLHWDEILDTDPDAARPTLAAQRTHLRVSTQMLKRKDEREILQDGFSCDTGNDGSFEYCFERFRTLIQVCHQANIWLDCGMGVRIIHVNLLLEAVSAIGLWLRIEAEVVAQSLRDGHRPGEGEIWPADNSMRESQFRSFLQGITLFESLSQWPAFGCEANAALALLRPLNHKLQSLGLTSVDDWPPKSGIGRDNPAARATWEEAWEQIAEPTYLFLKKFNRYESERIAYAAPWNPDPKEWQALWA